MRYEGQNYEQEIPVPDGEFSDEALAQILERYHELHEEFYGYRFDGVPIEMVRLLVTRAGRRAASCRLSAQQTRRGGRARDEPRRRGPLPGDRLPVHAGRRPRRARTRGRRSPGPLVVESMDTTVVVPPGWTAHSDEAASSSSRARAQRRASAAERAERGGPERRQMSPGGLAASATGWIPSC